jgi:polar amino acid transport system substrate-binding protein
MLVVALVARANASDRALTVAVSLDIPPYVMNNASRGAEVDIMRRALPNYKMKWLQMDYQSLETAVSDRKADIGMSVQTRQPNVFYSVDYIGFANFAISKKADNLKIEQVADLKDRPVLTWEDAWTELGDEFKNQYAPGSAQRTNYIEIADQARQVRQFWEGTGKVIVIDRSIFDYFSEQQGHSPGDVEYHALFPKVTKFKVAFADAAMRDEFNAQLKQLCKSGEYDRLLKRYNMKSAVNPCNR